MFFVVYSTRFPSCASPQRCKRHLKAHPYEMLTHSHIRMRRKDGDDITGKKRKKTSQSDVIRKLFAVLWKTRRKWLSMDSNRRRRRRKNTRKFSMADRARLLEIDKRGSDTRDELIFCLFVNDSAVTTVYFIFILNSSTFKLQAPYNRN